nr:hypothetical protein [Tanacetum cinerariifolium]
MKNNFSPPIIEDWHSDDESEVDISPTVEVKIVRPSIEQIEFVKTTKEKVKNEESPKQHKHHPRGNQRNWNNLMSQRLRSNFKLINKACYIYGSFEHLMRNNSNRVNHKNFANKLTYPHPQKGFVSQAVLTRSGKINTAGATVTTVARPINTACLKSTVNHLRLTSKAYKRGHLHDTWPNNKFSANKNNIFNKKVNTVRVNDSTARDRAIETSAILLILKLMMVDLFPLKMEKVEFLVKKGKQHKASYKAKLLNTISKPLHMLHMDLFGPKNVKSLMKKSYYLVVTDDFSRFYWVLFLATKGETSGILKTFVTRIKNQLDCKVKVIRCDNGTAFKNSVMNQFCEDKGIKRELSVARTPQQNRVAKRRIRTLIEAARTMLVDSKLPITFWAEVVNTACNVLNRALVTKPHNKIPYELIHGRPPLIDFMKPFGYPVTILNTRDNRGKFEGKANEGYFVGYSVVSKAMRVFNKRTRIVEETLNIRFHENAPNVKGNGPDWLFDIDSLTISMNYVPVVAGNQTNDIAGSKENFVAGQDDKKKELEQEKKAPEVDESEASDNGGKNDQVPSREVKNLLQQERQTENINRVNSLNTEHSFERFSPFKNAFSLSHVPIVTPIDVTGIFGNAYDDDVLEKEVDINNVDSSYTIREATKLFKDHPQDQVIGSLETPVQTRQMFKTHEEFGLLSSIHKLRRTNHKDFQNCLFACFLSQMEPKKPVQALQDPSWVEAMQNELLQFKLLKVWTLVDLPKDKWVGHSQEEGIDYDEVFAPVARIEAIRLFLAYASFKDFIVYQMDVKSTFLYGRIEEEVYVCQPPSFEDPNFSDKVYKVEKALYGLHQAPRACQDKYVAQVLKKFDFINVKTASTLMESNKSLFKDEEAEDVDVHLYISMIGSLMYLSTSRPDITIALCACARFQVNPKTSHLHAVKRIFRYLKGQPKLGLWYPKDSPFYLEAYSDSDYVGASLDRKSIIGGCQFPGKRLISWKCKKQTIVANSTTKTEYVAATNCYGQVNDKEQIQATVDKTKVIITEDGIRSDLRFDDAEGTVCLLNEAIFEGLARMGAKTTAWNEFNNTMASAIICLADNQKFNFLKYIFNNMVKSLEGGVKFYLFPRFLQVFLDNQVEGMARNKEMYIISSHTKKIFANIRRIEAGFSRKTQKPKRKQRKEAEVSYDESEDEDHVPTPSSDPLPSGEDSSILNELMVFCIGLQEHVLDLQEVKDAQAKEIAALKKKVTKLNKWRKSRSRGLRRLKKIGLGRRVKSPMEKDGLDDKTQGRTNDDEMFGVDDLDGEEVVMETTTSVKDSAAPTTDVTEDEVTMAQALATLKSTKPKVVVQEQKMSTTITTAATTVTTVVPTPRAKGIVFHKQKQSQIPTFSSSKNKGKAKMIEPEVPIKKNDQLRIDEEYARNLKAEEQEAIRLSRSQQDKEATNSWDNMQAMMDADRLLAGRLQAIER